MSFVLEQFRGQQTQLWFALAIVVLGLLVYGFRDVSRFSLTRAWAISQVAFSESLRRRVLLIAPLAILGVIIVSQLQKAIDEQDVIRQTVKFSLFAAGMVVCVTTIILACTNLPREIESRVIYTVVTKPTTRLEIVVGKVIGFAKVSGAILLIMGVFTFFYLHARAWGMRRDISDRLAAQTIDPLSRSTYEYWAQHGLLSSRTLERAADLQVLAREPKAGDTKRWFYGMGEGDLIVPFEVNADQLVPAGIPGAPPGAMGVGIRIKLGFAPSEYGKAPAEDPAGLPVGVAAPKGEATAQVGIQILDANMNLLVGSQHINNGQPVVLTDPTGNTPVGVVVPPQAAQDLLRSSQFYVNITGLARGFEYSVDVKSDPDPLNNPVCLIVPGATQEMARVIGPVLIDGVHVVPTLRSRMGSYGQQLRGGKKSISPVAVYSFRGAQPADEAGSVGFEIRTGIERSDSDTDEAEPTRAEIVVVNRSAGSSGPAESGPPVVVSPENNRTTYFNIPAAALRGGDFDIYIRNLSEGHYIGLHSNSLAMVVSIESFNVNLFKSLFILWLLSVLVVIISIFCSTWLSWPIAIMLTLLILLGHWGVAQLGDSLAPGIGNQVATDIFGQGASASQAKVVSGLVEALSKLLNFIARWLPDIEQFSAIEDIERGMTISMRRWLWGPLLVLVTFGLPMIVLSYVFLRNKEVAP